MAKRWSFHGPRGMDEAKRSICWLESMAPTTEFSLVPKQAQAYMEKPLAPPLVNRSPLNRDGRSLREDKGCLDAQRARKLSSTAPTMTDEVDSGEKREC